MTRKLWIHFDEASRRSLLPLRLVPQSWPEARQALRKEEETGR